MDENPTEEEIWYRNDPRFLDRHQVWAWANSIDPDLEEQSDLGLHYKFAMHYSVENPYLYTAIHKRTFICKFYILCKFYTRM